jgi:hypothetical protein
MTRRATPAAQEHAARQAAIRTIARGERPVYRAVQAQDGRWYVLGYPWLSIDANASYPPRLDGPRVRSA